MEKRSLLEFSYQQAIDHRNKRKANWGRWFLNNVVWMTLFALAIRFIVHPSIPWWVYAIYVFGYLPFEVLFDNVIIKIHDETDH